MNPELAEIYLTMSRVLIDCGPVVIAGGAVRDTLMGVEPKDYDVFILNTDKAKDGKTIAEKLAVEFKTVEPKEYHKSEPYLVETVMVGDAFVQVMASSFTSVTELVASFDWNVCLFAYDGEFHQRTSIEDIAPGKDLVLQKNTFPVSTLRRGFRFSERFGMKLPKDTLIQLCIDVLEQSQIDDHNIQEPPL